MYTTRNACRLLLAICFSLLLSCDSSSKTRHYDYVAEPLPVPQPQIQYPDTLPYVTELPQRAQEIVSLRRAFFTRDFATLDKALNAAHAQFVEGKVAINLADKLARSIKETGLAGLDACKVWLAAMPSSYAAHRLCGEMWQQGAWMARTHYYNRYVSEARWAIMYERLARSNALLVKAISLSSKPVEAMSVLAENYFMVGADKDGNKVLQLALELMPSYGPLHETRVVYATPEWGGSKELVEQAIAEARKAGVTEDWLSSFHDSHVARPAKNMTTPGAERAYWERAISTHPTRHRLESLADHLLSLQNLHDTVPVTTRLISEYPDVARGYSLRAYANQQLGHIPEALQDYYMAAAMGDDYATDILIRAHMNGGLGLPVKDLQMLDQLTRYGAALGTPSAVYGLATVLWEGDSVGKPFYTDIPQSLAWYQMAARTGLANAQYDMGWLLITRRVPRVGQAQAENNGLFWLRRAAEQGQQFAKKKLEEGGFDESEIEHGFWDSVLGKVRYIQAYLVYGYRLLTE